MTRAYTFAGQYYPPTIFLDDIVFILFEEI